MIATTQGSTRPGSRRDQLRRQFDDIADLVSLAKTIPGGADVTLDFGWMFHPG